jgi:uncharacterized protein (TIGR02594 family)
MAGFGKNHEGVGKYFQHDWRIQKMNPQEPKWLAEARKHIGTTEIHGAKHNGKIIGWWKAIKMAGITTDEVPWCASFTGACLEACGIRSTRSGAARSYLNWGIRLPSPVYGCLVVFQREPSGGHVGFVVGKDQDGNLQVLGGNQSDAVNIKTFKPNRVLGYRWPSDERIPVYDGLTVRKSVAFSTREA